MTTMVVTAAPTLSHLPNVELCQTGTWHLSTGPATFTPDDFMSAVAALECPAVRRPVLKLGHAGAHGVGEAALGYIDNLRGDEDWRTLIGDYAGMPGWLATPDVNGQTVIASAFPDRSIEGSWDWHCQMGHTHPFVITAVALLGAELPGVGTLASLQDVGRLYGIEGTPEIVAASAAQDAAAIARFTVPVTAGGKDQNMPNPTARTVAATVTSDDVRRAFYESPVGSDWDAWIEEIQIDPLQIIYIDDDEGVRYRVPITIDSAGDGPAAITFGLPVPVVLRYEDVGAVAASAAGHEPIRFASKSESRPGQPPKATTQTPAEPPVVPSTEPKEADAMSDTMLQGLRERFSLPEDADEATILAKADELLDQATKPDPATEPAPTVVPEGSVIVPRVQLEDLQTAAQAGVAARTRQLTEDRDREISAAIGDGRIAPARKEHWEKAYATDREGASTALASLPKGLLPVSASGYTDTPADADPAQADDYWFAGSAKPALTNAGD